ncbi:thiol reductase thioredoxin [Effusibacillus lacus]|uniref:Thioredoxin n=2 Tax=Effusibacillus lacus TaxID=1348429 RepID=A0A292YP94_9BACL|nr:thioredoxin [Effusibacillus lacus]GAX90204.1 thiol reductase thioredoxin [Effusibacillus lacus]
MANVQNLTTANFDQAIQSGKVLVDFWATWCGPCRMQTPVIEKLASEMPGIKFAKVNVDDEPSLAQRFGVMSIPTLLVLNNGKVEKTLVGFHNEAQLKAALS